MTKALVLYTYIETDICSYRKWNPYKSGKAHGLTTEQYVVAVLVLCLKNICTHIAYCKPQEKLFLTETFLEGDFWRPRWVLKNSWIAVIFKTNMERGSTISMSLLHVKEGGRIILLQFRNVRVSMLHNNKTGKEPYWIHTYNENKCKEWKQQIDIQIRCSYRIILSFLSCRFRCICAHMRQSAKTIELVTGITYILWQSI